MDLQAQDRAHRIGQTRPVNVYRLVTEVRTGRSVVWRLLSHTAGEACLAALTRSASVGWCWLPQKTIEEKIVERAEQKLFLDAIVVQQGRLVEANKSLSKDDLLSMVRFGADEVIHAKTDTMTDEGTPRIWSDLPSPARGEELTGGA